VTLAMNRTTSLSHLAHSLEIIVVIPIRQYDHSPELPLTSRIALPNAFEPVATHACWHDCARWIRLISNRQPEPQVQPTNDLWHL